VVRLVKVPEWLSPLVAILPVQELAAALAAERGVDVDQPFGLRKVTRTL
jgi:glucosamine--fructose-6-phosphate aminotransferase (isomerizing)